MGRSQERLGGHQYRPGPGPRHTLSLPHRPRRLCRTSWWTWWKDGQGRRVGKEEEWDRGGMEKWRQEKGEEEEEEGGGLSCKDLLLFLLLLLLPLPLLLPLLLLFLLGVWGGLSRPGSVILQRTKHCTSATAKMYTAGDGNTHTWKRHGGELWRRPGSGFQICPRLATKVVLDSPATHKRSRPPRKLLRGFPWGWSGDTRGVET